jgi:ABC-type nitrate/sulfonate/bicarbonate transport system permease component
MFRFLMRWLERAYAPAFEILRNVPPSAATRIFTPF